MENASDRGFISGFIGVGIHMTIQHILQHILIANRCKKELAELKDLVMSIELTIMHIQKNRLAFRTGESNERASAGTGESNERASAVNGWLEGLDRLLLEASKMVQRCSIPKSHGNFSGCQTEKKINPIILKIRKHEELSPLLVRIPNNDQVGASHMGASQKVLGGLEQTKDRLEALASCATTSQAATAPRDTARKNLTLEAEQAFANLEKFLTDNGEARKICMLRKAEREEAQILIQLFESQNVRNHFSDGLFICLNVSQRRLVTSLRTDLYNQIGVNLIHDVNEEDLRIRLNQRLLQSTSFVLCLEDIWGRNAEELLQGLGILDAVSDHIKCKVIVSSTDPTALPNQYTITIGEPVIVGQKQAFSKLEELVIDDVKPNKIGVVGKCGAGKTLLLKTLFNRQKVRTHFSNGLLLWLTFSQKTSVTSLKNDLCKQIAIQKRIDLSKAIKEDDLREQLRQSSRFLLFLDDAREKDAETLFQILGIVDAVSDSTKSKVIISSRDISALSNMGVTDEYRITIEDLNQDDSWQLFKHHAFPCNIGNLPSNIDEEMARLVCGKCEGLPRAIKVVGRAMADSTLEQRWEWALERLTKSTTADACLRLSFDAVGIEDFNMQLCFLHIAVAFLEDAIIDAQEVIPLWMGEGLLAKKMLQHEPAHILADHCLIEPMIRNTEGNPVCLRMQNPFEIGRLYLDLLAERFLIEPTARDADGRVLCFRMLKAVRDLAIPIAKNEEYFYCFVGIGLDDLQIHNSSKIRRVSLSANQLSFLEQFSSSSEMCSLLISQNTGLTKIPKRMIGSMLFLKVLDLSGTSALSLPKNVGYLKELRCLKLAGTKIKRLPKSLGDLGHLEILDVSFTDIEKLPSDIHMLRSLRYLGLRGCKNLQNLPHSISGLLSLQYLYMDGCSMWRKPTRSKCKRVASMESLGDLVQLKQLAIENQCEEINKVKLGSTLDSMTEMDSLLLILPKILPDMETLTLPKILPDMETHTLDVNNNMSKLRILSLKLCDFTKMEIKMRNGVCGLKNLSYLKFYDCKRLADLQNLHMLQNLRQLEIILCPKVNFPKYEEAAAFPSLRIFSLVGLENLEELPDAMPFLEVFTIMDCPKLRMLPRTYLNFGTRIKVYGLREVVEDLRRIVTENMDMVEMAIISIGAQEIIQKHLQVLQKREDRLFGESWCNELFLFVKGYMVN